MNGFKRQGKIPAIVDYVAAGSRFKSVRIFSEVACILPFFRLFLPKDNQVLTLVLGGKPIVLPATLSFTRPLGIRAPRTARNTSEKSEPCGPEAAEFATKRYMQRDVEFEVHTVDKSGGFIGGLYLNKTENVAVILVREGFATVHSFSADGLSWAKQLRDAEVSITSLCVYKWL